MGASSRKPPRDARSGSRNRDADREVRARIDARLFLPLTSTPEEALVIWPPAVERYVADLRAGRPVKEAVLTLDLPSKVLCVAHHDGRHRALAHARLGLPLRVRFHLDDMPADVRANVARALRGGVPFPVWSQEWDDETRAEHGLGECVRLLLSTLPEGP